jgi:tetratricopeptide (TPR) repeat protein
MDDLNYHKKIVKKYPDNLFSLCILGHYYEESVDDIGKANYYYNKMLKIKPDIVHILCRILTLRVYSKSILDKLKSAEQTSEVLSTIGYHYDEINHLKIAKKYYLQSYKLNPYNHENLCRMARIYNTDKYLIELVKIDWDCGILDGEFYETLIDFYDDKNQFDKKIQLYERALLYFPRNVDISVELSELYGARNDKIKILEEAYMDNKTDIHLILHLCILYIEDDLEKTIALFKTLGEDEYSKCYGCMNQFITIASESKYSIDLFKSIINQNLLPIIKILNIDLYEKLRYSGKFNENQIKKSMLDNCSICLENFSDSNRPTLILSCNHCIHLRCLHDINDCPICRTPI